MSLPTNGIIKDKINELQNQVSIFQNYATNLSLFESKDFKLTGFWGIKG